MWEGRGHFQTHLSSPRLCAPCDTHPAWCSPGHAVEAVASHSTCFKKFLSAPPFQIFKSTAQAVIILYHLVPYLPHSPPLIEWVIQDWSGTPAAPLCTQWAKRVESLSRAFLKTGVAGAVLLERTGAMKGTPPRFHGSSAPTTSQRAQRFSFWKSRDRTLKAKSGCFNHRKGEWTDRWGGVGYNNRSGQMGGVDIITENIRKISSAIIAPGPEILWVGVCARTKSVHFLLFFKDFKNWF